MEIRQHRSDQSQPGSQSALFDLAKLRVARGMRQKAIAAKLQVNASGVTRYEAARNPRVGTLASFVQALGGQLIIAAVFEEPDGTTRRYLIKTAGGK